MKKYTLFALLCAVILSCGGNNQGSGEKAQTVQSSAKFPYPKVPAMMQSQEQAAEWFAVHFWDKYFEDENRICDSITVEQAYSEYAALLITAPPAIMVKAQDRMLSEAEKAGELKRISALADKYFFDANSPYRNEECYIPVLGKVLSCPESDDAAKEKAAHLLPLISLNRLGTVAADFTYTLKNGRTARMHDIKAERLIMFFSNPGCTSCKEIIEALKGSPKVSAMLADGSLKILNLYPDSDLGEWYKYMSHYPEEWINAFDAEGAVNGDTGEKIYYLRAIPSLYLLDAEKRVLCKDAPSELVLNML